MIAECSTETTDVISKLTKENNFQPRIPHLGKISFMNEDKLKIFLD